MKSLRFAAFAAVGLALLAPGRLRAETTYRIQPLVKAGDRAGSVLIKPDGHFEIGTLNDQGQLIFTAENAAGGQALLQYAAGQITPVVVAGGDAPGGKWPQDVTIIGLVSMNQKGNAAFAAPITIGGTTSAGTFWWDAQAKQVKPVALSGMPAVGDVTFVEGGFLMAPPTINNRDEIAFVAKVKNAAGQVMGGDFFLGQDGKLQAVGLPDQMLPDGTQVLETCGPTLNDAGVVTFEVRHPADPEETFSAYRWEKGAVTPLAVVGTALPGGQKILNVYNQWGNNQNQNVLLWLPLTEAGDQSGLYLSSGGKLTAVAVPGQEMPGGGKLQTIGYGVSYPNDAGEQAFLATLQDGSTAVYRMAADGTLSLVLRSGAETALGKITGVGGQFTDQGPVGGFGVGLNNHGQVVVTVQTAGSPDTVVLLTPAAP